MTWIDVVVLALLCAVGTGWIWWLRRGQRAAARDVRQEVLVLRGQVESLRSSLEGMRLQVAAVRCSTDAVRRQLDDFVNGPPSMRVPTVGRRA